MALIIERLFLIVGVCTLTTKCELIPGNYGNSMHVHFRLLHKSFYWVTWWMESHVYAWIIHHFSQVLANRPLSGIPHYSQLWMRIVSHACLFKSWLSIQNKLQIFKWLKSFVSYFLNNDFILFFLYLHTPIRYGLCNSYFLGIHFSVNNV